MKCGDLEEQPNMSKMSQAGPESTDFDERVSLNGCRDALGFVFIGGGITTILVLAGLYKDIKARIRQTN